MTRWFRHRRDERGVSLILVLVTLVVFGLLVPVLGQFGSTNGVSGYVLKGQRFDRYAAEAGMQGAIAWAQHQRQAGRAGADCPTITTGDLNGSGTKSTRSVTVTCRGFTGNGLPQATPSMPAYAIMAGGDSSRAISVTGNGAARTDGPWWSAGGIRVDSASIDASADYVGAKRTCRGITASPTDCPSQRTETLPAWSTGKPPVVPTTIPVDRPRSGNPCDEVRNGRVTVEPGLHWQESFFDEVGDGHCGPVTIELDDGGPHLFDFTFYGGSNSDWRINPASRGVTTSLVSAASSDGSCGAILFAADFTMRIGPGATVDLCGAAELGQHLALAQVTDGADPRLRPSNATTPIRWSVSGPASFDFAPSPPTPPGVLAGVDCVPNRSCTGGYVEGTLRGNRAEGDVAMTVPDPVPAGMGAKVDHLHLEITHREQGGSDIADRRVWISAGLPDQFECQLSDPGHRLDGADNWTTNSYDCDVAGVARPYFPTGSNLTVRYQVQLRPTSDNNRERSARVAIDAVQLSAEYAPPTARTSSPTGDVLRVDAGGTLRTDGTVYLPTGDATIDFGGAAGSTFGRGVIVSTIEIRDLPDAPTFAPFALPGGGNYTDRLATFRAFLAGEDTPILTARVRFCDVHPEGGAPTPPCTGSDGGPPQILAWDPKR